VSGRRRGLGQALSRLSLADVVPLIGMTGWALVLPVLKRLLPLPALVRLVWARPRSRTRDVERERRVAGLVRRLYRSPLAALDENCLERSLLTYRLLARLDASPELVTGVRRQGDAVIGHAWVTVDGEPVGESRESVEGFAPVLSFGPDGRQRGAAR
jgi:Transglutaminase-like superfamily